MRHRGLSNFCLITVLVMASSRGGFSQAQKPEPRTSAPASATSAPAPPSHPITSDQVRAYLKVTHYESFNRTLTHKKMEAQRQQLPQWYPSHVWDEIEDAIDGIDPADVLTPVYQKYISQEDAVWLIRLSATPQMQKVIASVYAGDEKSQNSGAAPVEARDETLRRLAHEERNEVERIMSGMTPAQLKELQAHAAALQAMQPTLAQLRKECSEATQRKQSELAAEIVNSHQFELADSKKQYDDQHAHDSPSTSPQ